MVSKNISITAEIYAKLKKLKHPNESFSGVIGRILEKRADIFEFIGMWEDWVEIDTFEEGIKKARDHNKRKNTQIIESWTD